MIPMNATNKKKAIYRKKNKDEYSCFKINHIADNTILCRPPKNNTPLRIPYDKLWKSIPSNVSA